MADKYLEWQDGEMFIFDDSFDHEVWHFNDKDKPRMVLILDLWHPELTIQQIAETILTHYYDTLFIQQYIG